jgi:repressor LexA
MLKLTKRQMEILDLIHNYIDRTGAPPTRAEIAEIMGFRSPNAAEDHLRALERKGVLALLPGTSRGIKILINTHKGTPIIGHVAAGKPILATENIDSYYKIDKHLFVPTANYLLRVKGDSMQEAGILDGDLLVVHSTQVAKNGQIVVARLDNEVTVKRFQKDASNQKIYLMPENDAYEPIELGATDPISIEGIGVGIIRTSFTQR